MQPWPSFWLKKHASSASPKSVPEIVKTEAVFIAEHRASAAKHVYLNHLKRAWADIHTVPDGSLILMHVHRLEDLLQGRGCYADVKAKRIVAQRHLLGHIVFSMPGLTAMLADLRKHAARLGFATRSGTLIHYCFGGYLDLRSPALSAEFCKIPDRARADALLFQLWLDTMLHDILTIARSA